MKDKEIKKLLVAEKKRQKSAVNLIASENYVSKGVLEALGSEFTNKYAEGYPGKRYYGGNENSDKLETLCQERALKLFGLSGDEWAVNVQPLSGSPANLAVYLAILPLPNYTLNPSPYTLPKIMGMELSSGGHLTHGHKVSISGKMWTQIPYGVKKDSEVLDYEEIKKIALENKPAIIVAGYTAYSRIIDFKKFQEIADSIGAYFMVDMSHFAGLVAGGVYPSPFPYADVVTTTTHKTLRGPRGAIIFTKKDTRELYKLIDKAVFPGIQGGPHLNQIAGVAVALEESTQPKFKKYAEQIVKNAKVFSEEMKKLGWRIISGGTDTHLFLVDTLNSGARISGKEASDRLEREGIIVNKNAIPFDTRPPADPSGIRLGTPAQTTRGWKEKDFIKLAGQIDKILRKE